MNITKAKIFHIGFLLCLILTFYQIDFSKEQAKVRTQRTVFGISVVIEIQEKEHRRGDSISLTYQIENRSGKDIFLVMPEHLGFGDREDRRIYLYFNVAPVPAAHSFELPKLQKLRNGKICCGKVEYPVNQIQSHRFKPGDWVLSVSFGYLQAEDAKFFSGSNGGGFQVAVEFEKRQKIIDSAPVEVKLIE